MGSSMLMTITENLLKQRFQHLSLLRSYCDKVLERGRAMENVHFLKIQYEQLQKLMKEQLKKEKKLQDNIDAMIKEMKGLQEKIEKSEKNAEKRRNDDED